MSELHKLLRANVGANDLYHVFTDFVEVFALAIRNRVDRDGWQDREDEFERIKARYRDDDMQRFAEAFAHVTTDMADNPRDVLGELYMQLEIADKQSGQFFTPYDVARLMAELNVDGLVGALERQSFVTMHEPACGAGAFIVAMTQSLHQRGVNFQQVLHVQAEDISRVAVHMCYIHLSLLHVPALVARRDTLTRETWDVWPTPAHVLGVWDERLRWRDALEQVQALTSGLIREQADEEPTVNSELTLPEATQEWSGGLFDMLEGVS